MNEASVILGLCLIGWVGVAVEILHSWLGAPRAEGGR